ncbi:hypothetical protein HPP92_021645 [Vanilla planifolia]|uniref:DNA ligase n=1 Tax=Vanilla planifolia TaxID=51239 RepID=A0A835Q517_VANPL|nr:hypothetical protein HPP92_021645 [Vanilla planifolia]
MPATSPLSPPIFCREGRAWLPAVLLSEKLTMRLISSSRKRADLKLGISEKSIFHEFHPDAEDLFNVTCDLKLVCDKLKDKGQRYKRQDIEVGKAVRPQLAMRINDSITAWKKLHGKQVVVECKFDGDRIQIHKNGKDIHFFSRNFLDHTEYIHGMSDAILQNVLVDRCILDGEMLVWDTTTNRFAEFGSNQEIAKAAKEGFDSDRQLCYIAFDVLYVRDTSVIHQSLIERQELLRKVVKPWRGRLEILVPNDGLNDCRREGEPCWSIVASCVEDVDKFFKETVENRDEGIVLKDLSSCWEPGDRSGKWLKLKPDYIHAGADLDVLIIGGYFGSGRHGGEVAQFLVGLAEKSDFGGFPKRFLSFCRLGSGLSDEDLDALITRLKPYFRKNEYPKKTPHFYSVTNNSKERPDVWIESPDKSIILSITSDIRTIKSVVFAAPYSLRFPRIQSVRYDKPWYDCLDVQSFIEIVQSSNGNTFRGIDQGSLQHHKIKHNKLSKKGERKNVSIIPAHFIQTDISVVKEQTSIFADMMFYIVNVPSSYSVDYFHKLVAENGGSFSMNLNDAVTHSIAAERKGIKYQAATRHGDVIHYSWVLDCCTQQQLVHIQPKYFLFHATSSKKKNHEEIDTFSDYYYWDVDVEDIKQIFNNIAEPGSSEMIEHYRKKYVPDERMSLFHDCFIYLYDVPARNAQFEVISELALRRIALEITMHGGKVCTGLQTATHCIAYSILESLDFDKIYKSFPPTQRQMLHQKRLYVLGHHWIEDSLEKNEKQPEGDYSLKPDSLEEHVAEEIGKPTYPATECGAEELKFTGYGKRKRRKQTARRTTAGKPFVRPTRRTRQKVGYRSAKLGSDPSDDDLDADPHRKAVEDDESARDDQRATSDEVIHAAPLFNCDQNQGIPDSPEEHSDHLPAPEPGITLKGKLEVMTDPIHAMLLDMIPSLGQSQKLDGDDDSVSIPARSEPHQKPDADQNTVKKKVSYKDVAGELLKDW